MTRASIPLGRACAKCSAHGLRRRGIDVTTTAVAGLLHASDEDQRAFALRETRVIFTNDSDFLRLAGSGFPHAGIVYCSPAKSHIGDIIRYLALMDACLSPEDVANQIEYL